MNHTLHQKLVELRGQAKAWLEGEKPEGFSPMYGICRNLPAQCDDDLLDSLMEAWPSGSGDEGYPVPHHDKGTEGGYTNSGAQEMWNPEFEYARNRWALLEWLIEQTASEADQ